MKQWPLQKSKFALKLISPCGKERQFDLYFINPVSWHQFILAGNQEDRATDSILGIINIAHRIGLLNALPPVSVKYSVPG